MLWENSPRGSRKAALGIRSLATVKVKPSFLDHLRDLLRFTDSFPPPPPVFQTYAAQLSGLNTDNQDFSTSNKTGWISILSSSSNLFTNL